MSQKFNLTSSNIIDCNFQGKECFSFQMFQFFIPKKISNSNLFLLNLTFLEWLETETFQIEIFGFNFCVKYKI